MNAATVGVVALAAVNLSSKAVTDRLSRILILLGGTAGLLQHATWYFPVLMVAGGLVTSIWDYRGRRRLKRKLDEERRIKEQIIRAYMKASGVQGIYSKNVLTLENNTELDQASQSLSRSLRLPSGIRRKYEY